LFPPRFRLYHHQRPRIRHSHTSKQKFSHSDNAARDIPLEKVRIQPRSNKKCTTCGLAFQDSTRLRRHGSRVHSAPDKRECDLCHALVTGEEGLQRHYRRHTEQADQSGLEYFEEAREKMTRKPTYMSLSHASSSSRNRYWLEWI
jgi:hypothetical protein